MRTILSLVGLKAMMADSPGLMPVAIHAHEGQIEWCDLGTYHCYEAFFRDALANFTALRGAKPEIFMSSVDVLSEIDFSTTCLPPSAFIFHAGRCGSTLLAKILARSRAHLVLSEAPPHNQIWPVIRATGNAHYYEHLALAMGRKRLPSYHSHIVKFTSFNIVQFESIRRNFPDVPALFLFRNPGRTLASLRTSPPSWLGRELGVGKIWHETESAVGDFFSAAREIEDRNFRRLDYTQLTPENLPRILEFFNLRPEHPDLRQMMSEFTWSAKSRAPSVFVAENAEYQAPPSLERLYGDLLRLSLTDWPA